jgi:hypothetical protein
MESMKLFNYSRTSTLILLPKLPDDVWDVQPANWPNTIRWNAGHVWAETERFLHDANNNYENPHPEWMELFLDGSRPSEWGDNVPNKDEIIEALKEQATRIETFFEGKLGDAADDVRDLHGTLLDTADAALQFVTWHEGLHLGIVKSLKLVIENEQ